MLSIHPSEAQRGAPLHRREWLCLGGLSLLGLTGSELQRSRAAQNGDPRAHACVFVFLFGGPSHIDLWDMKPAAPAEIRGEFRPRATTVPGLELCEHLPRLAQQADKLCLLRSMNHRMPVHGPACSELYTGRPYFGPPITDEERPEDWPSLSALLMRYGRSAHELPPAVVLPWYAQFDGQSRRIAGQTGGRMGRDFDPVLVAGDPSRPDFAGREFQPRPELSLERLRERRQLLRQWQAAGPQGNKTFGPVALGYQRHAEMAFAMLERPEFARALDLASVSRDVRDRYGWSKFGQSLLLTKRLLEAGISLVTVNWDDDSRQDKVSPFWDTHHDNFPKLKQHLCPVFDQAFAAFLEDLAASGLLDTTLVVASGEFGRTPRIGDFSQNAMTQKTGRDHWPHAFTALLAGGGVRGGQVYGGTDAHGAYVRDQPVTPADLAATILHHLGVDPQRMYADPFQQVPRRLSDGKVIRDLG